MVKIHLSNQDLLVPKLSVFFFLFLEENKLDKSGIVFLQP